MFNRKKDRETDYPPGVATTLKDLMRFEYLVQSGQLLPPHPVFSILAGSHASKLRGRGLDFEEVRQYVAGDDIRNIDWRVTARTGRTHSKVFNEEKERPTFILVDQSSWMFFGSGSYIKSVSAAHAAAISTFYTLKRGDRTGGIIFNEAGFDHIEPKRSKSLAEYFLRHLVDRNRQLPERKRVVPNTELLDRMLQKTRAAVTHDHVITVISDFSAISQSSKDRLRDLSSQNDVILIQIHDPLDERLPDGKWLLSDGKYQVAWQNNRRSAGRLYSERFRDMRQNLNDEFRRYRIPVVWFSTEEPVEDQIMKDMGKILRRKD